MLFCIIAMNIKCKNYLKVVHSFTNDFRDLIKSGYDRSADFEQNKNNNIRRWH